MKLNQILDRKISLKKIWTILAIAVFVSALSNIPVFAPVSPDLSLDDYPSTAYFVIKTDGTNIWAVRYDGDITYEGTTAHTVINSAISGLPSRTSKYTVAIRGSYTITSSINLASYLILDFSEAKITCSTTMNALTWVSGDMVYVDIIGGHWTGGGTSSGNWLNIPSTSDIYVHGCTVTNFLRGIETSASTYRLHVDSCNLLTPLGTSAGSGGAVHINGAKDCLFTGCRITSVAQNFMIEGAHRGIRIIGCDLSGWSGSNLNHAIYVDYNANQKGIVVDSCLLHQRGTSGGSVIRVKSSGHVFSNNIFRDLDGWGIELNADGSSYDPSDNIIIGNTFVNCTSTWAGSIYVGYRSGDTALQHDVQRNQILDNHFFGGSISITVGGYNSTYTTDNTTIRGNNFNGVTTAILIANAYALSTIIEQNIFTGVTTEVSDSGTNTLVRWNDGYKTEASGSALNATDTTFVITHGLATTPIITFVSFNATEVESWNWTADASEITITMTGTLAGNVTAYWEARTWNYP